RLWRADWRVVLGIEDGVLKVSSAVVSPGSEGVGILIDLPSILQAASEGRAVTALGGPHYLLTASTRRGNYVGASIDLSQSVPYTRLESQEPNGPRLFDVLITSVNETIAPRAFVFPRFSDHMPLSAPTEMTLENLGEGANQIGAQILFH